MYIQFITILTLIFCALISNAQIKIEGEIMDQSNNLSIPGAHIRLEPFELLAVSDENGYFSFSLADLADTVTLTVSFVGKEELVFGLKIQKSQQLYHLHLYMNELGCEKCKHTDMVLIEETALANQNSKNSILLNSSFFEENLHGSFAKSLERLAGINAINVGTGIAKPVIRGLTGNRILVTQNGIPQQGQQWGNDHGLEIDALSVDRMEIVKGPASLLYGSDGLGGIINVLPERIAAHNSLKASVQGIYKNNNNHWGTSANINSNYHNWFIQTRYTRQESGDYQIPTDSFIYNGFVLPIFENNLKNTAVKEENISFSAGTVQKWGVIRLSASHFGFRSGIFSGAMGIPRAYELTPDGDNRDIDLPSQSVSHFKTVLNNDFIINSKADLKFDIGYQRNLRKEFSFPHAHNRDVNGNSDSNLALQLLLQTISSNLRLTSRINEKFSLKTGANFQYQHNKRSGFDYLLPDFLTLRSGIYTYAEYRKNLRLKIDGGIRFDYAYNKNDSFLQPVNVDNGIVTLGLSSPAINQDFYNFSAAAGIWYALKPEIWSFRLHFGRSFRVPHPVETVSNGVHHGTFRHERGTADLNTESGLQLDLGTDFSFRSLKLELSAFANYYNNYIYLSPTARFSPLPDAGQLFQYVQTDAFYSGAELSWSYDIIDFIQIKQALDYVFTVNLESGLGLPFTPPAALQSALRIKQLNEFLIFTDAFFEISHRYVAAQNRVDRNERTTPAYHLFDLSSSFVLNWKRQKFVLGLQVQNVFNVTYYQHLSRYRLINVPEQGRNVVLSLKVPFGIRFKK